MSQGHRNRRGTVTASGAVGLKPLARTLIRCVPDAIDPILQGEASQRFSPSTRTSIPVTSLLPGPVAVTISEPDGLPDRVATAATTARINAAPAIAIASFALPDEPIARAATT